MGAVGGMLGVAGGASGTGYSKPTTANLAVPVTQDQVTQGQAGVNNSLGSQQALLAALQGQNAAQNQSNLYGQTNALQNQLGINNGVGVQGGATTAQMNLNQGLANLNAPGAMGSAMAGQGALANQLGGAGGIGAQTGAIQGLQDVLGQQQATAGQLQGIANGTGPNPAQAALNQATGQNVANQAALMAGQRGAGANVGLMARQAAQQGAATQQQAVGQGATMQAQQQLNAINAMTGQQQAMAGTNQAMAGIGAGLTGAQQQALAAQYGQGAGAIGQQQAGIGQLFNQGAANVAQQQAQQGINAGINQNNMSNLIGTQGQNVQANLGNAGQLIGGLNQANATQGAMQSNVNSANAQLAQAQMGGQQKVMGGLMNAVGIGAAAAGGARGGEVSKMADGGFPAPSGQGPVTAGPVVAPPTYGPAPVTAPPPGPQSSLGQFLAGNMDTGQFITQKPDTSAIDAETDKMAANNKSKSTDPLENGSENMAKGLGKLAMSAMAAKGGLANQGGHVKAKKEGQKAEKSGNSYDNDKVPAMLSEGEVVIPRSVMQSSDPVTGSADFVRKVLAKKGKAS